jgi:ribonuclease HI
LTLASRKKIQTRERKSARQQCIYRVSWGFVIRDHEGSVVLAGAGNLGSIPDAITAEAAACAKALQEATDHDISRIQLETDSMLLKQAYR